MKKLDQFSFPPNKTTVFFLINFFKHLIFFFFLFIDKTQIKSNNSKKKSNSNQAQTHNGKEINILFSFFLTTANKDFLDLDIVSWIPIRKWFLIFGSVRKLHFINEKKTIKKIDKNWCWLGRSWKVSQCFLNFVVGEAFLEDLKKYNSLLWNN